MHLRSLAGVVVCVILPVDALFAADGSQSVAVTMRSFVDAGRLAGAVTVVAQDGKILNIDCVGRADVDGNRPTTPNTLYRIASMTKPITAVSVMILQDEGKLSVDDPVQKYLPEFAEVRVAGGGTPKRPITIRDLLTHTSGVATPPAGSVDAVATLADNVAAIAKQPLQFEPGAEWKYGVGLTVAGRIVEVVAKMPFEKFVDERICKPLGMTDTTYYPNAEQSARVATLYRWDKEANKLAAAPSTVNLAGVTGLRRAPNPSGGMFSTALDYFHFLQMVLNGGELNGVRFLSEKAVAEMTKIQTGDLPIADRPGVKWGLGWGVVDQPAGAVAGLSSGSYGHGGAYGTLAWVDPAKNTVMIMLIARSDMNKVEETKLRTTFVDAALFRLP
jgi:CubicO group peptidase (beta-lactamase class C family)